MNIARVGAQRGYVATCACVIDYGIFVDTDETDAAVKWRGATITAETIVETCEFHVGIEDPETLHDTVAAESQILARARAVCIPPGSKPRILDWSMTEDCEVAITVGHFTGDDPTEWQEVQAFLNGLIGCVPTYVGFN